MNKTLKKMLTKETLFTIVLLGVLLLVMTMQVKNTKGEEQEANTTLTEQTMEGYREECERRLSDLLVKVKGVGAVKVMVTVEGSEEKICQEKGLGSEPYVVQTLEPEVTGVVVVAKGGGQGKVDKTITEIVQALFGIEAHKVKVVAMRE